MQAAIRVTCAIIVKNQGVLCAQRSKNMPHPLLWEFPGGKIEAGESATACIIREIKEELNLEIKIFKKLESHFHTYPGKQKIELIPFICGFIESDIKLKEHKCIRWVMFHDLNKLDWAEADLPIVSIIQKKYCIS